MEYQKIINLLDNKPHQSSSFRTKNWAEINDMLHGVYGTGSQSRFKTSKLSQVFLIILMHIYLWMGENYWSRSRWW